MAKAVGEIERVVHETAYQVYEMMPEMYREKPDAEDRLGKAWHAAAANMLCGSASLSALGDMLRERAGITGPTPYEEFEAKIKGREAAKAGMDKS